MPNSPHQRPVVDTTWLAEHRDEVVLADVRWYLDGRSGRQAYLERHLPGAVFVDLDRCLSGPPSAAEGRHPLPAPGDFAKAMQSLGISDDTAVVAYDDDSGRTAARLVSLLRVIGREGSVLDGGVNAWPGPFSNGPEAPAAGSFFLERWPLERFATADDIGAETIVLDARAPEHYRGETEPVDARAGHIPGPAMHPQPSTSTRTGGSSPRTFSGIPMCASA